MFMQNLVLHYTLLENTELQRKWIRCHLKERENRNNIQDSIKRHTMKKP